MRVVLVILLSLAAFLFLVLTGVGLLGLTSAVVRGENSTPWLPVTALAIVMVIVCIAVAIRLGRLPEENERSLGKVNLLSRIGSFLAVLGVVLLVFSAFAAYCYAIDLIVVRPGFRWDATALYSLITGTLSIIIGSSVVVIVHRKGT